MDYFKSISNQLLTKLGAQKEQIEGIQQAIKDSGFDGSKNVSFAAVRQKLKERDLSDQEIEMLFSKYDLDQNRELDEQELRAMFADLEGKKNEIEKEMAENENKRPESSRSVHRYGGGGGPDMSKLTKRVDRMEYTLSVISSKIDSVLGGKVLLAAKPDDVKTRLDEEDLDN
ncbi:unnamed protein product [Oppiella nova]|nr:unnamed protein product [Oppiella nova]CAG2171440.1 unnamed protein product [Oppiella nova]